jgi:hypothetical protein
VGDGRFRQCEGRQCAADDADDLVVVDQPLRVLLRALRIWLVEPHVFNLAPGQRVAALGERQQVALCELFSLFGDLSGLGPQRADLDRFGGETPTDEGRSEAGAAEEQLASVDSEVVSHAIRPEGEALGAPAGLSWPRGLPNGNMMSAQF